MPETSTIWQSLETTPLQDLRYFVDEQDNECERTYLTGFGSRNWLVTRAAVVICEWNLDRYEPVYGPPTPMSHLLFTPTA